MRGWTFLLAGLIVWTVHFFASYIIASIFLSTLAARALALLVTFGCLGAVAVLLARIMRSDTPTAMDAWMRTVSLLGLGLSALAITWQGLPAVIS